MYIYNLLYIYMFSICSPSLRRNGPWPSQALEQQAESRLDGLSETGALCNKRKHLYRFYILQPGIYKGSVLEAPYCTALN